MRYASDLYRWQTFDKLRNLHQRGTNGAENFTAGTADSTVPLTASNLSRISQSISVRITIYRYMLALLLIRLSTAGLLMMAGD
jgi:hypothetical protein